jgi:glycosyltransferase involved in cell wall biosynthesis
MNSMAVLIPHYNNHTGLIKSLAAIGADEPVDIWVIDDGSISNKPNETLARQAFKGLGEIHFIYLPKNQGIQYALNVGLKALGQRYEYIARLDCGDLCRPNRFRLQRAFLEANPDIMLLGSAVIFIDTRGNEQYTLTLPLQSEQIRAMMHINCAFIHPTVMWRSIAMQVIGDYPVNYPMAEDFAFFWRFVLHYETANMDLPLVRVELNPAGLSMSRRAQQLQSRLRLQLRYADWSWLTLCGMLKTLALMVTPYSWILWFKQRQRRA